MGSPVMTLTPTMRPSWCWSSSLTIVSIWSKPEFAARVLGMMSRASAKARTPRRLLPLTVLACSAILSESAISTAPAPGNAVWSSMQFLTARSPSRTASLIWAIVCALGPLMSTVHENGLTTFSTKVYFSSPSVTS
eukprot:Amastigsp_a842573_262.p5 type:complete len:136 gc:universal Amastigsp_a842573_262:1497-1090(-)